MSIEDYEDQLIPGRKFSNVKRHDKGGEAWEVKMKRFWVRTCSDPAIAVHDKVEEVVNPTDANTDDDPSQKEKPVMVRKGHQGSSNHKNHGCQEGYWLPANTVRKSTSQESSNDGAQGCSYVKSRDIVVSVRTKKKDKMGHEL